MLDWEDDDAIRVRASFWRAMGEHGIDLMGRHQIEQMAEEDYLHPPRHAQNIIDTTGREVCHTESVRVEHDAPHREDDPERQGTPGLCRGSA